MEILELFSVHTVLFLRKAATLLWELIITLCHVAEESMHFDLSPRTCIFVWYTIKILD